MHVHTKKKKILALFALFSLVLVGCSSGRNTKTYSYYDAHFSGNYIKTEQVVPRAGGESARITSAILDGMYYYEVQDSATHTSIIIRDDYRMTFNHNDKTYAKDLMLEGEYVLSDDLLEIERAIRYKGDVEIDGKTYETERYVLYGQTMRTYCFDGDQLVYTLWFADGIEMMTTLLSVSPDVPSELFDISIPEGYTQAVPEPEEN